MARKKNILNRILKDLQKQQAKLDINTFWIINYHTTHHWFNVYVGIGEDTERRSYNFYPSSSDEYNINQYNELVEFITRQQQ